MDEEKVDEVNIDYRFIDHTYKITYVLRILEDLEREHFALMVDRPDENHSEYNNWWDAVQEVKGELSRMTFIYKQLGGTFGSELPGVGS